MVLRSRALPQSADRQATVLRRTNNTLGLDARLGGGRGRGVKGSVVGLWRIAKSGMGAQVAAPAARIRDVLTPLDGIGFAQKSLDL